MGLQRFWAVYLLCGLALVMLLAHSRSQFQPHRPGQPATKLRPSNARPTRTSPRNTIRQIKTSDP